MKTFIAAFALTALTASTGCYLEQPFEGPGFTLEDGLTSDAEGPFTASSRC